MPVLLASPDWGTTHLSIRQNKETIKKTVYEYMQRAPAQSKRFSDNEGNIPAGLNGHVTSLVRISELLQLSLSASKPLLK